MPPASGTERDCRELLAVGWQDRNAFASQEREPLLRNLRGLSARKDASVVIYLCGFAAHDEGVSYLLPGDARLGDRRTWVPLREVLGHVRACPARHKLLLLDIMQPFTDPRVGRLTDDAAEHSRHELEQAIQDDPRLTILCACSPGQVSLTAEVLGQTVFGYYVARGLGGEADGWGPRGRANRRVSVQELAAFVAVHVDHWAVHARGARQTPQLLTATEGDFELTSTESRPAESLVTGEYPDWLRAVWLKRDDWRARGDVPGLNVLSDRLQAVLLRTERFWRAGAQPETLKKGLDERLGVLDRQYDEATARAPHIQPRSLAAAIADFRLTDQERLDAGAALRQLDRLDARVSRAKPDDKGLEGDRKRLETDRAKLLKPFEGKSLDLARVVLAEAAAESAPSPRQVRYWSELLKPEAMVGRLAEVAFLQRLVDLSADERGWPPAAAQVALRAILEGERAARVDPRAAPWVAADRAVAERGRTEGEALLFGTRAVRSSAEQPWRRALRGYETVNRTAELVRDAHHALDDARSFLPGLVAYLEVHEADARSWAAANRVAHELDDLLGAPPASKDPAPVEALKLIDNLTGELRFHLARLRVPFTAERWPKVAAGGKARAEDRRELEALLASPWPAAADRVRLWQACRAANAQLHQEVIEAEAVGSVLASYAPPAVNSSQAIRAEAARGLRRAEWSMDLLKLRGFRETGGLEEVRGRAARDPADAAARNALASALRQAWDRNVQLADNP
jgi:hypothetical protein